MSYLCQLSLIHAKIFLDNYWLPQYGITYAPALLLYILYMPHVFCEKIRRSYNIRGIGGGTPQNLFSFKKALERIVGGYQLLPMIAQNSMNY